MKKRSLLTTFSIKQIAVDIICWLLVLLFIYAAISKLIDYQKFLVQLGKSPVLTAFSSQIVWLIPSVEILIAILLSLGRHRLTGLYASFCMMVIFSGYIVTILKFSSYIPCSCGGILENMNWTQHLIFNAFFVVLCITGILLYPHKNKDFIAQ